MYSIYCHIFPNGKRYVGLTSTSVEKRWQDGKGYKTCPLVQRAIDKYGWENVEHVVLAEVSTKQEAEEKEREYIRLYQSDNPDHGYNILPGGDVATNEVTDEMRVKLGSGWKGKHRSESDRQKISEGVKKRFEREESNGHLGMKHTESTRRKMSESQREKWDNDTRREEASERMRRRMNDPEYREKVLDNLRKLPKRKPGEFKLSEDAKRKVGEFNKGRYLGEKSPTSKPVLQFTKDGVFLKRWANAGEAERAGFGCRRNISACCNGKPHVKTAGGYVWKFDL